MEVDELIKALQRVNVADVARDAVARNTGKAADLLREQLYSGRDGLGRLLRRYRSSSYADIKHSMNPAPGYGNPDLYLTGAFHRSLKAESTQEGVTFSSFDTKAADLVNKYSEAILDINAENVLTFADEVRPDFEAIITKITGLEFTA